MRSTTATFRTLWREHCTALHCCCMRAADERGPTAAPPCKTSRAGAWSDWSRPTFPPAECFLERRLGNTRRGRATAPAYLKPPTSLGLELRLELGRVGSGPSCKIEFDHGWSCASFVVPRKRLVQTEGNVTRLSYVETRSRYGGFPSAARLYACRGSSP